MSKKRNSEARLLQALNSMPNNICLISSNDNPANPHQHIVYNIISELYYGYLEVDLKGRFLFANETFCNYIGKKIDELVGKKALGAIVAKHRKKILLFFNQVYKNGKADTLTHFECLLTNNTLIFADISVAVIYNEDQQAVAFRAIVRDQTEAHKKQLELERYREFVENIDEGFFETDLKGNLTFINSAMSKIHGYSQQELIGLNHRKFAQPPDVATITEAFRRIYLTGQPAKIFNYTIKTKSGHLRNLEVSAKLIRDKEGAVIGYRGVARDLTEKITQEKELMRYCEFVESIDDGCFETDLKGNITFANQAMSTIHGYPSTELLGKNYRFFSPVKETKTISKIFNLIYKTGIPSRVFDYNILTKEGQSRNLEVSAKLIEDSNGEGTGFRGIVRDRTEKKIQELELERYQKFVENVEDACFEVDLKGNFVFFNQATCRIFGYPADKLMGMNNREYTSLETSKKIYRVFNEVFKTGKPSEIFDYQITRGDTGEMRFLDMSTSIINDSNETAIGFRCICRDVTDQKNAQQENERLTALLSESQRLEAIGTLAAGVAHNFNNLLMSIQGYVSLVSMGVEPDNPNYKRLQTIEAHIKKGSDLTLQLLNYANVSYNPDGRVNINEIIRSALSVFKIAHKQIKIFEKYTDTIGDAAMDRKQIEHVFMSLFKNAIQAMPDGGSLMIETHNITLKEAFVKAYDRKAGSYIKIVVKDTGSGMDQETLERIFEPFFTTKNFGMATGLGMAAVYGIIKKHQGIIEVESQKGEGTSFTIYLPSKMESRKVESISQSVKNSDQKAVLIVDDEEVFIKVISKMISKLGFEILSALNGHDALDVFRANHKRIDLVIMDMVMPGISGDQLLEMLQGINPDIRVILVSGYIKDDKIKNITKNSRRAFLPKPFQHNTLIETIENIMAA